MRDRFRKSSALLLVALPAVVLACGDSTTPGDWVVGNYTAVSFVTASTTTTATRDELDAGSTLTLNLNSDGTTSGHFHLAPIATSLPFDADMTGTWHLEGNVVEISQTADTFVRDITWTVERVGGIAVALVADQAFSGTRITVRLARE